MQRIAEVGGLFIAGNPSTNTKGTIVTASWLNAVQEEIALLIEGLGGTLNPAANNQLLSYLQGLLVNPGTIIDYAGTSPPAGYLACPTAQTDINRITYSRLFAAIGTTWGEGDGTTTFGMPWFAANYATVQANGNVGAASVGQVIAHTHTLNTGTIFQSGSTYGFNGTGTNFSVSSTGGAANLAAGVRVLKCVKY